MRRPAAAREARARAADHEGVTNAPADVRIPRTYLVMLAAAGGLGVGVLLVYFDYGSWSQHARGFARSSGPFLFWLALICVQTMLWALALPPLVGILRRHWHARTPTSVLGEVVPSAVVLTILVATLTLAAQLLTATPQRSSHAST